MIVGTPMASKKTTAKAPAVPTERTDGRERSLLTIAGNQAKADTERALLLKTLKANAWNLTHTARDLRMGDASSVLRGIDRYGLREEYEKQRGWTKTPV